MSSCTTAVTGEPVGGVFDAAEEVKARLCSPPQVTATGEPLSQSQAPPASRWSLRRIRATFPCLQSYSLPGVSKALRRWGIKLRHGRPQYSSPDPTYAAKQAHLLSILAQVGAHPEQAVALFIDEVTFTGWPEPSTDWRAQAPDPIPLADRKESISRRSRVVGALDASSGRVCFLQDNRISGEVFARFLRQVEAAYPGEQTLYLIWDNWPVHQSAWVKALLEQRPRLQVVPLPTYAPWLNAIEKLWRKYRQEIDYLHPLADDWQGLRERVKAFFRQFASGSADLLCYVGLTGEGLLARALKGQVLTDVVG